MYAAGRPGGIHFLPTRTRKPFFTKEIGASAASRLARFSVLTKQYIPTSICSPFISDDGAYMPE